MLLELRVQGLAVIDSAICPFRPGLNVVTGESGSGKSVLMAALGLAVGERGDAGLVRHGEDGSTCTAVFEPRAGEELGMAGLGIPSDDLLVLTRELAGGGRTAARVNSALVPVGALRQLGERLIERHGQGAAGRWLKEAEQRAALDAYGDSLELRAEVARLAEARQEVREQLREVQARREREDAEVSRAREDLAELEAAAIDEGETTVLGTQRQQLQHLARLREAAVALSTAVRGSGDEGGVAEALASALATGRSVEGVDPELDTVRHDAEQALTALDEVGRQVASYLDHLPVDEGQLQSVEDRLALLDRLARRHGGSLESAIGRREEARRLLGALGTVELDRRTLEGRLAEVESELIRGCRNLSSRRQEAASRLAAEVTDDLHRMLMPRARFAIRIWSEEDPDGIEESPGRQVRATTDGWDRVQFQLAANPGDPARPLGDAASGGELSRLVLALLARISGRSSVDTVVFDEIDEGLGGEAANRVGELLLQVSHDRQVICITHLAPIAARAGFHLLVSKSESEGRAVSQIDPVDGESRVEELARLLAGTATPVAARAHAQELLAAVGGR